jgi:hypothetical protein
MNSNRIDTSKKVFPEFLFPQSFMEILTRGRDESNIYLPGRSVAIEFVFTTLDQPE